MVRGGSSAVSVETQLEVLPLQAVSPQPDGVLGVGAGEQVLGELRGSLYLKAGAVLRERNTGWGGPESAGELETNRGEHPLHRLEDSDVRKVPRLREIFEVLDVSWRVGDHHSGKEGQQT